MINFNTIDTQADNRDRRHKVVKYFDTIVRDPYARAHGVEVNSVINNHDTFKELIIN